jgi:hypothetical protein
VITDWWPEQMQATKLWGGLLVWWHCGVCDGLGKLDTLGTGLNNDPPASQATSDPTGVSFRHPTWLDVSRRGRLNPRTAVGATTFGERRI